MVIRPRICTHETKIADGEHSWSAHILIEKEENEFVMLRFASDLHTAIFAVQGATSVENRHI